jgi:hypothetical protein
MARCIQCKLDTLLNLPFKAIFFLIYTVLSTAWELASQIICDSCNDYLISPDLVVLILMERISNSLSYHPKSDTDQWDWRVDYQFYTLAFWHLHYMWPHTHNNACKTHMFHKPRDHCTENPQVSCWGQKVPCKFILKANKWFLVFATCSLVLNNIFSSMLSIF